jgi:hypothetical protein
MKAFYDDTLVERTGGYPIKMTQLMGKLLTTTDDPEHMERRSKHENF